MISGLAGILGGRRRTLTGTEIADLHTLLGTYLITATGR